MVCIFCLNETNDNVLLYGASELAKHARNVVTKHFWFDVSIISNFDSLVLLCIFKFNEISNCVHRRPMKSTCLKSMRVRIVGQQWNRFMIFIAWLNQIIQMS